MHWSLLRVTCACKLANEPQIHRITILCLERRSISSVSSLVTNMSTSAVLIKSPLFHL